MLTKQTITSHLNWTY